MLAIASEIQDEFSGLAVLNTLAQDQTEEFPKYQVNDQRTRVCVTGAAGFLGSHLVAALLADGCKVVAAVRDPKAVRVSHLHKLPGAADGLKLVAGNLLEWGSFDVAVSGCDCVFHTASPFSLRKTDNPDKTFFTPAVEGTLNVLESCRRANVKRVVVTSSTAAVVGAHRKQGHLWTGDDWSEEAQLLDRQAWYPLSKLRAERAAWEFVTEHNDPFELVTIQPSMMIGPMLQPALNASNEYLLQYINGGRTEVPRSSLAFSDVRDVAQAHVVLMHQGKPKPRNLCVGAAVTMDHLCCMLRGAAPRTRVPTALADDPQEPLPRYDTRSLARGMSFRGMVQTVHDTVASFRGNGYLAAVEEVLRSRPKDKPATVVAPTEYDVNQREQRAAYLRHDVSSVMVSEEELQQFFNTWDVNGNGYMSKEEFREFYKTLDTMGCDNSAKVEELLETFGAMDTSGDGRLSLDEFCVLMLQIAKQ